MRRGAVLSVGVGFVSTLLGIGGGVIHVPLMIGLLGFPAHVATATSHYVLAIMSGASSLTHVLAGSFSVGNGLRRAVSLSAGVVAGAQIGALASRRVGGLTIRRLLALGLFALAVRLAITALQESARAVRLQRGCVRGVEIRDDAPGADLLDA